MFWVVAVVAAACMVVQDIMEVLKAQGAARNRAWVVACADQMFYLVSIVGTTIAAFTIHGGSGTQIALVIGLVTVANFAGNLIGVWMGKRYIHDTAAQVQDAQIATLKDRVDALDKLVRGEQDG